MTHAICEAMQHYIPRSLMASRTVGSRRATYLSHEPVSGAYLGDFLRYSVNVLALLSLVIWPRPERKFVDKLS